MKSWDYKKESRRDGRIEDLLPLGWPGRCYASVTDPCEFLSKHQSADDERSGDAGRIGEQAGCEGMATMADGD